MRVAASSPLALPEAILSELAADSTDLLTSLTAMKRLAIIVITAVVVGVGYLALSPSALHPVAWVSSPSSGYTGVHTPNTRLATPTLISLGADFAPEHIVLGEDGLLYASVAGGRILRMQPDGSGQQVFATTGGRVLGFDFDYAGHLIAADVYRGLLSITPQGKVTVLADSVDGTLIGFADAVIVARSSKIYFSDASTRFTTAQLGSRFDTEAAAILDIVEHSATGRILEFDPTTQRVRVVAHGLSFANGVTLSSDERTLLVAETGASRIWKIAVTADNLDLSIASPLASVLLDRLPGMPDNLMRGLDGRIWVGLPEPRSSFLDTFASWPTLRKVALRLPKAIQPQGTPYGHALAFTEDGRVVADLQDPSGAFAKVTGITETRDRLYLQTLNHRGLGWLPSTR